MKLTFLLLTGLLLYGCCPTKETIIQRDTLTVYQQGETDTLTLFKIDTVYQGENVKYILRIDTVYRKAIVYRKPDTIYVPYTDTVQVVKEVKSDDYSLMDYLKAFGVLMIIGFIITLFRK